MPMVHVRSQTCLAGGSRWWERRRGFSATPSPAQGPEKGPGGGSVSPCPAPLRPTHGVPSPPAAGKAATGAAARCGAGGRSRGGAWRRADEMRAQPLWAAALVLAALAGVGVGGERGSGWRGRGSPGVRAAHPAAAKFADLEPRKPSGRVLRGCARSERGQAGAVGAWSWGPSRPGGGRVMGHLGAGPPGRRSH